jgi:hypothetical protein
LTNWPDFFKLGVAKQIWIRRRTASPGRFFPSFRSAVAGLTTGRKKKDTMNPSIQFKTTVPNNLIRHLPLVRAFLLIALVLGGFALSQTARAVSPAPDGGYPNGNTAEGDDALFSLTSGFGNTANGADALFGNTSGSRNTAVGTEALFSNSAGGDNTATGVSALHNNTTGNNNTANGLFAL